MSITRYIKINVFRSRASLPGTSFGSILAVYQATVAQLPERFKSFSSPQEVSQSSLPDRLKAPLLALFETQNNPGTITLGRRNPGTAKIATVTVATASVGVWNYNLAGRTGSYTVKTGETTAVIAKALAAGLEALGEDVTVNTPTTNSFAVTANVPGVDFTLGVTPFTGGSATVVNTQANVAAEDLSDALDAIERAGDRSYGLAIENRDDASILEAAAWVETRNADSEAPRFFVAQTDDPRMVAGTPGNIADQLAAKSYKRTHVTWNEDDREFQDIKLLGEGLSFNLSVRAGTWEFLSLTGITPANRRTPPLMSGGMDNIKKSPASFYITAGKRNVVEGTKVANGLFIDQVTTEDWTVINLRQRIFDVLTGVRGGQPYDRDGAAVVEGAMRGLGDLGVNAGHYLAESVQIQIPDPNTLSSAQRASRCLPNVRFRYVEQGSLHCVDVEVNIES